MQVSRPWSSKYPRNYRNASAEAPKTLQLALRVQVLQAVKVLHKVATEFRTLNLEIQTIDQ